MQVSLLPPNATQLERAVEAGARPTPIDVAIDQLWDPATCPAALLPFLAYSLSVDSWDADWPEAVKREAVATSIAMHRRKGTRLAVDTLLSRYDEWLHVIEWHEANPRADPNTFEVRLPLDAAGGVRASAAYAETIMREVARVKPLREHFTLVQHLTTTAAIGIVAAGRAARFDRLPGTARPDPDPSWLGILQTEDGEPFTDEAGVFLMES